MRTLVLIALLASASAAAQLRTIPADAKPAQMSHVGENVVAVDGKPAQLAAGAQIRDEANRIILPAALPAGARVKYALDANGHVHRVWILTPQEAEQKP